MPEERNPEGKGFESEPASFEEALERARFETVIEGIDRELNQAFDGRLSDMEAAADRVHPSEEPAIDDDTDAKIARIELRARAARTRGNSSGAMPKQGGQKDRDAYRGVGVGLTVAYTIIGVPLLGAAVGFLIDQSRGTSQWTGICTVAGAFLGVGFALFTLNRTNMDK